MSKTTRNWCSQTMDGWIDPSDDVFGAVLNCAVRYAIGRETYMPSLVQDFARPLLPRLTNKTLWCMERDIVQAPSYGDEDIDKPSWMRFLEDVRAEIKKREEAGKHVV